MPQWIIDSPEDVIAITRITIILGVLLIAAVGAIVLVVVRSKAHLKAGPVEFGEDETHEEVPELLADLSPLVGGNGPASCQDIVPAPCEPYVLNHSKILEELQKGNAAMELNLEKLTTIAQQNSDLIEGLNRMQEAELFSLEALIGHAEGTVTKDALNRARLELARAQGYKDRKREAE